MKHGDTDLFPASLVKPERHTGEKFNIVTPVPFPLLSPSQRAMYKRGARQSDTNLFPAFSYREKHSATQQHQSSSRVSCRGKRTTYKRTTRRSDTNLFHAFFYRAKHRGQKCNTVTPVFLPLLLQGKTYRRKVQYSNTNLF